jgi:hypothetical protein
VNTGVWQGDVDRDDLHRRQTEDRSPERPNRLTVERNRDRPDLRYRRDLRRPDVNRHTRHGHDGNVWNGTSIANRTYTDAKVVSISGTSNRVSVAGTATVPDRSTSAATYVGPDVDRHAGNRHDRNVWTGTIVSRPHVHRRQNQNGDGERVGAITVSAAPRPIPIYRRFRRRLHRPERRSRRWERSRLASGTEPSIATRRTPIAQVKST